MGVTGGTLHMMLKNKNRKMPLLDCKTIRSDHAILAQMIEKLIAATGKIKAYEDA